ncbi:MAG: low-specificity L-threonine aldolase [Cyanobacteria bacterium REEB67]|nr:low-specificity L-threonine aldolase [Cyanobacteria bacterium REEB67]
MKIIDLRSDTVTLPSAEMRQAMFDAELGDDVFGEDPTVNKLEREAAAMIGKEAAIFVASGTMGNLIATLVHCRRGEQILLAEGSHIFHWEQGGASALGGIAMKALPVDNQAQMKIGDIEAAINGDDVHLSRTRLICLENTYNGQPLSPLYLAAVQTLARQHGLKMHLDGARIFNAAIASDLSVKEIARHFDSVQFCCSKGLAAPVGSLLCGDGEFIAEARRVRKMLGGGMRQAGVLAAACLLSLEVMVERLAEDHKNAQLLAEGLAKLEGITVLKAETRTNMVFFKAQNADMPQTELQKLLKEQGLLVSNVPKTGLRAVTHYGIEGADITEAISRVQNVVAKIMLAAN